MITIAQAHSKRLQTTQAQLQEISYAQAQLQETYIQTELQRKCLRLNT